MVTCTAAGAAMLSASCTSPLGASTTGTATNTASTYTPVTGIEVDPHSLFFRQGCGTNPGQVYKYAVVVSQRTNLELCTNGAEQVVASGVYDCFADAVFLNLGGGDAGLTNDFDVLVAAFDAPTYAAQAGLVSSTLQAFIADHCATGADALAQAANWTTTCVGHQETQVQSLVACDPVQSN